MTAAVLGGMLTLSPFVPRVVTSPIYRIRSFAPCSIGVRFMVP